MNTNQANPLTDCPPIRNRPRDSHIDQIKAATSTTEVNMLLAKLQGFDYASPKTVRRAIRAAKLRVCKLGAA